ncbi:MAG: site-2 protease family protein [Gemmatimonadota bacterium]
MSWSIRIGRVAGTEVKVHLTFFLLLLWYAMDAYKEGGTVAAVDTTVFMLVLFACVLLHEFGHIFMARHFGVRTPDVMLLPIGGVARLERMPEEPKQELLIALAGPAVTLAIALLLYAGLRLAHVSLAFDDAIAQAPLLVRVMYLNASLLVFNLIPAFPMDGGRVLRSLLAMRLGLVNATRIASYVGQGLAVLLGIFVLYTAASGGDWNPILLLIALFVYAGARAERTMVQSRAMGSSGLTAGGVMDTRFVSIPIHARLERAAELLLPGDGREFPVVDNGGRIEGVLTRENLIRGLAERGPESTVGEAMSARIPILTVEVPFELAIKALRASGLPALPVVDVHGAVLGMVTAEGVAAMLGKRK